MNHFLDSQNFPSVSAEENQALAYQLSAILNTDFQGNVFNTLANYQRLLADNQQREQWPEIHKKLETLFKCGKAVPLDGPMIGIPMSIRDTDYFKDTVNKFGEQRSALASIELMATAWNATFADTGLWMGKTYEPVSREQVAEICENDDRTLATYNNKITRVGRNFFREPPDPGIIQGLGMPALTKLWHLKERPTSCDASGFIGELQETNLEKEKAVPYSKTGGIFLADMGQSVVPEMHNKSVYQLNYRWQHLNPSFPMTRLIDEVVQIADGVYLGQLVFASKHYNLGTIDVPFIPGDQHLPLGESYHPTKETSWWQKIFNKILGKPVSETVDYGYQNNGYFLMMDPAYAKDIYANNAFPQLRPRPGETGWLELGYGEESKKVTAALGEKEMDWANGWKHHSALFEKFTRFVQEPSPRETDLVNVESMRKKDESILQMLKRFSDNISAQTKKDDHLQHFEKLNQLFRSGVAPKIRDGVFRGYGEKGFNTNFDSPVLRDWYGKKEVTSGFNYYHGATLNLHWGFADSNLNSRLDDSFLFPSALANLVEGDDARGPNVLNMVWRGVGKYIFPWAGKSFERISGRTLSMLLDESDDLETRYPERVKQIKTYLASAPYYNAIKKNREHYWPDQGLYAEHLAHGSWDKGMRQQDKDFWIEESHNHWVWGNNLQDKRILAMDAIMRIADMNYRAPDTAIQALANAGPSPFIRQGYCFLGAADQTSILPSNNGEERKKNVFQFQYRYPMLGGPVPINYCLDEIVEIAEGLFLGQLIYATALDKAFHSSADPAEYNYQLFGYFMLLDDDWERHRQAIKMDVWRKEKNREQEGVFSFL